MSTDTFLAVFRGSKTSAKMQAWMALPDDQRKEKERVGIAAWRAWAERNADSTVQMGGPLGRTKAISEEGILDVSNDLGAFMVVRAASHEEAAKLFENHPHFTHFPGESVEVMPVLAIPAG